MGEARRVLRDDLGGALTLREELARANWVNPATNMLTTDTKPFNIFARLASGVMTQPSFEEDNSALGKFSERFVVCRNLPASDERWDSDDPEWVGKASMSLRHRFLTTKNLHWQWFNALCVGMLHPDEGGATVEEAIAELEAMRTAALEFTAYSPEWSKNVGLFFHVFGHNSVNSLHLHIIDLDFVGPTFKHFRYKNCPLDSIIKVLKEEVGVCRAPTADVSELEVTAKKTALETILDDSAVQTVLNNIDDERLRRFGTASRDGSLDGTDGMDSSAELIKVNVGDEYMLEVRVHCTPIVKGAAPG